METAKHFGSKLRKTLAALLATMALMAVLLPGALAVDLNVDVGFYFKQSRGGTCTLASAAMMLRRRAYLDGMDSWVDVTENGIKSTAWSGGLSHSFTYNDMHVGYATLPSGKAAKTEALVSILAEHPEGIVLYDRTRPHAVLLTDYTDGVFYCSDPSNGVASGRVPLSAASISIGGASCIGTSPRMAMTMVWSFWKRLCRRRKPPRKLRLRQRLKPLLARKAAVRIGGRACLAEY